MKKRLNLAILLAAIMMVGLMVPALMTYASNQTATIYVKGTYDQTEARQMLEMINDFRAREGTENGNDPWYYAPDGSGTKVPVTGLAPLQYDYELEKIAMQRAAEIAVNWGHNRPDGSSSLEIAGVNAENIAMGSNTAAGTFEQWLEADEPFKGQGHRRNMLGGYIFDDNGNIQYSNFLTTVGIAHFVYDGVDYWVQVFGAAPLSSAATTAEDGEATVPVTVDTDMIKSYDITLNSDISVAYNDTYDLDNADIETTAAIYSNVSGKDNKFPIDSTYTWESLDLEYATVSGTTLTGVNVGTGSLSVLNKQGIRKTVSITVGQADITDAGIETSYDGGSFPTGFEFEISAMDLKVLMNGDELKCNTDYMMDVKYTDGSSPSHNGNISYMFNRTGQVRIIITGRGNYTGTCSKIVEFTIVPADLSLRFGNLSGDSIELEYGTAITLDLVTTPNNFRVPYPEVTFDEEGIVESSLRSIYGGRYDGYFYWLDLSTLKAGSTTMHVYIPADPNTNNLSNELSLDITVNPRDISDASFIGMDATYEWTGDPITPVPVCRVNGEDLEYGTDYTIEYYIDGVKVDEPIGSKNDRTTVTVKAIGTGLRYSGTAETSFVISPLSLNIDIEDEYPYRADGVKPVPVVTSRGTVLSENLDYTVSYGDNNTVGTQTGSVTVTGIGAYAFAGNQTAFFDITKADIADAGIETSYDGGSFPTGFEFEISDMDLKVLMNGNELKCNTDYTMDVKYTDGSSPSHNGNISYMFNRTGQVRIIISGRGNYTGTCSKIVEFTIVPADLSLRFGNLSGDSIELEYGTAITLDLVTTPNNFRVSYPVITFDEEGIVESSLRSIYGGRYDGYFYWLDLSPLKEGSTTMHVKIPADPNTNNASNELTLNITVTKKSFSEHAIAEFTEPDAVYTYIAPTFTHEPEIKVTVDGTKVLIRDTDYKVEYANNIFAGEATATITPIGEYAEAYSGQIELPFEILTRDTALDMVSEATIGFGDEQDISFKGAFSSKTPVITVSGDSIQAELTEFSNGQGKINVKGIGIGTSTISFDQESDNMFTGTNGSITVTVSESDISDDAVITINGASFEYTGQEIKPSVTVSAKGVEIDPEYYTVTYSYNTEPGTATVSVVGKKGLTFEKSISFDIVLPDTSELASEIAQAESLLNSVIVSEDGKDENGELIPSSQLWVTQEVYNELQAEINFAKRLIASDKFTASEVSSVSGSLGSALSAAETSSAEHKSDAAEREQAAIEQAERERQAELERQAALNAALAAAAAVPQEIQDLKAVKISKPKAAKKKVTVKWKKVSKKDQKKIGGIEIEVATDADFVNIVKSTTAKKSKTNKTIKGLQSKSTYWVRIRAYKNAADGKHVSAWKTKKVKVK